MNQQKKTNVVVGLLLWIFCAAMFFPMLFIIINAFKTFGEVVMNPLALPVAWNLDNFKEVVRTGNYVRVFSEYHLFCCIERGNRPGVWIHGRIQTVENE